jgi:beta-galactosidase
MLNGATTKRLQEYVENGGTLISEGLPGYFGDHGRAGQSQPNRGLDMLFGARERYVEFTPDLLENLTLEVSGHQIYGRYFLQQYTVTTGRAVGRYAGGQVASVENQHGKGRTLLIGTFPGAGYYRHHSSGARAFFAALLKLGTAEPRLQSNNPAVQARLHTGTGGTFLWIVNPSRAEARATVRVNSDLDFRTAEDIWNHQPAAIAERSITVTVPRRDAAVVSLR